MDDKRQKMIAKRVASRSFIASSGTNLSTVFQHGSSQAKMALDQIEDTYDKALKLIDDSERKEHIYSEAGDLIGNMRDLIDRLRDGLDIVSYAAAKIEEKKLKNKLPSGFRDEIDKAVSGDT